MFKKVIFILTISSSYLFSSFYYNFDKKVPLISVKEPTILKTFSHNSSKEVRYFKTPSGKVLGVDNKIIIYFNNLDIQEYIEKEFSLKYVKTLSKNMYVYSISNSSETLKIANRLNKIEGIKFAHPDFIISKENRSNDPLFQDSWHLDYWRINIQKAWQYSEGEGVIVGIYDEGFDLEHEDLRANIIGFGNYTDGLKDLTMIDSFSTTNEFYSHLNNKDKNAPRAVGNRWHGTACAGVIAAIKDNYLGSVGVAPKSKLIVARYSKNNISDDSKALIDMANNGAAIISNSWGTNNMLPAFEETLKLLATEGRDGKGILIFFAAGNDGCNQDQYFRAYGSKVVCSDDPNDMPINDESESPYVISIAATTNNNQIASYSNYGSSIDFAAPGGFSNDSIVTTDAMGEKGFTSGNYVLDYNGFSGTSAAAPIAAGIAALVLSVNPNFTKDEVLDILKSTAKKYGQYQYDQNGRNDHYGYGFLNAGDAVEFAKNYGKHSTKSFSSIIYNTIHQN